MTMIYCVEDDSIIREMEVYTLEQTGFAAHGFSEGTALFGALAEQLPELIVLDIMLPGQDGIEILTRLRADARYRDIPVIMATAKGTEMDKITGLDLGADDYLVKPFGVMEMVARIHAVLRRSKKPETASVSVGAITLNTENHTVTVNGSGVVLTHKEFDILALFMAKPGAVFNRARIMNEVWGSEYVGESRTVDMHIKTLRQKLGPAGGQIKTVVGVGYRLECEA